MPAKRSTKKRAARKRGGLTFNHAMVYTRDLARALSFYRDALGLRVVDEYPGGYARMVCPGSTTTIALHLLEPKQELDPRREGIRLYFEVEGLLPFCKRLAAAGVKFDQMPETMPWGWQHAYLKDPDGHEISLYRAGAARLRKTRIPGHG